MARWNRAGMGHRRERRRLHDQRATDAGVAVLALRDGDRALTLDALRIRLGVLLEPGPSTLVLDLSGVQRLSSDGFDGLLWLHRRCAGRAVRVVLREPSRHSVDLLRRAGLLAVLPIEGAEQPGRPPRPGTPGVVV